MVIRREQAEKEKKKMIEQENALKKKKILSRDFEMANCIIEKNVAGEVIPILHKNAAPNSRKIVFTNSKVLKG